MKVCLLTRYFDFRNAGLGRVSKEIASGLVGEGHSVKKVSTDGTSLYSYFYYTLVGIPSRMPVGCDIYHALTPMEAMWLPKEKSVVTFHDLFQITNPHQLGSGLGYSYWKNLVGTRYFKIAVNIAKRCRGVVAVSEQTKQDLVDYLGLDRDRVKVIRSGISQDLIPKPKRDKVSRVGYLGQLDRRKRVHLLIDAFKHSHLEELAIGGIGVDEFLLKALAYGDDRIKFLGLIPDRELVDFYNSLDAFVFPTWLEGYGLPIVEAMACRKPVIVLSDAVIPEEVRNRCVVIPDLMAALWLAGSWDLGLLCSDVDIEGNYEWARGHRWNRCVGEYIKLYEEILGG